MVLESDFIKEFRPFIIKAIDERVKDNNFGDMNTTEIFKELLSVAKGELNRKVTHKYSINNDLYNSEDSRVDKNEVYDFVDSVNIINKFIIRAYRNHIENRYRLKTIESIRAYILDSFDNKSVPMV